MSEKHVYFSDYLKINQVDNNGRPLPVEVGDYLREEVFPDVIPQGWRPDGDASAPVYTNMGAQVATGYLGIYCTDYGMYLVVDKTQINRKQLQQVTGNTADSQTDNVDSRIIYKSLDGEMEVRYQIRQAGANSFPPNFYYINVFDAAAGKPLPTIKTATISEDYSLVCQAVSCRGVYTDSISPEISQKWPFVRTDYEELCSQYEALSLLGKYQVSLINQAGTRGIVNVFCNMAVDSKKRYAGMNMNAMVNALYDLCEDAPEFKIIIPFRMGCTNTEEWETVSRMLNCRLRGKNVVLVVPDKLPESEPKTADTQTGSGKKSIVEHNLMHRKAEQVEEATKKPSLFSRKKAEKSEQAPPEQHAKPMMTENDTSPSIPKDAPIDAKLISLTAESVHEAWVKRKENEGWRRGAREDYEAKMTPFMISYSSLPKGMQKEYEDSAKFILEALKKAGYHITK